MQATTIARPIPLSSPWPVRWWRAVGDRFLAARVQRPARPGPAGRDAVPEWDIGDLAALNDTVLRDIGVPEWLREEAAARRDSEHAMLGVRAGSGALFDRLW